MHDHFITKLLQNNDSIVFLPQNLPINILHYMNGYEEYSVILLTHGAAVIYKDRFKLPKETPLKDVVNTKLFESCYKKYSWYLLQELDYRLRYMTNPIELTVDNIFLATF